tara:strand:+ start:37 stop:1029 length:993 start_codon:yes stop_codon:yes gene_type:complete
MEPRARHCDRKRGAADPGTDESDKRRKCDTEDAGSDSGSSGAECAGLRTVLAACIDEFVCPISHELPVDPVIAEDGRVYERECIEKWLAQRKTSPATNEPMGAKLIGAVQVRSMVRAVAEWAGEKGEKVREWIREEEMFEEAKAGASDGDRDDMLFAAACCPANPEVCYYAYCSMSTRGEGDNDKMLCLKEEYTRKGLSGMRDTVTMKWLEKAASMGSVKALVVMYHMLTGNYRHGYNSRYEDERIVQYTTAVLTEAAMRGDVEACCILADIHEDIIDESSLEKRWREKVLQCELNTECEGAFEGREKAMKDWAEVWLEENRDVVDAWEG